MIETETSTRARANTHRLADGRFEALVRITDREAGVIVATRVVALGMFATQHEAMEAGKPLAFEISSALVKESLKSPAELPIKVA